MQKSFHNLKGDSVIANEGTSGTRKDFLLKAIQDALLDMKCNVDLMLKWEELGMHHVGSEDSKNGSVDMQKGIMSGGLVSSLGCKKDEELKGKKVKIK